MKCEIYKFKFKSKKKHDEKVTQIEKSNIP